MSYNTSAYITIKMLLHEYYKLNLRHMVVK